MKRFLLLLTLTGFLLAACSSTPTPDLEFTEQATVVATLAAQSTETPMPTPTASPTSTTTPTPTKTTTPTATPAPQVFGRIFPEGSDSIGVTANRNTGSPNSENTHFDIAVPQECFGNLDNCPVYSPVNGTVWRIYQVGNPKGSEGWVISMHLSQSPEGIENVLGQFNIDPDDVTGYSTHLGHIVDLNPTIDVGSHIEKGTLLADGVNYDPLPKVAHVLYIWYGNGNLIQVSPCSVANESSYCEVCYNYDEPCIETNLNFPDGGIQWWNPNDPFWDTH